jgi:hypothetical protein
MNSNSEKLILLLAASNLSERTIYEALRDFERRSPSEVTSRVQALRHVLSGRAGDWLLREFRATEYGLNREHNEIASKVIQLLIEEAGLRAPAAAQKMVEALNRARPDLVIPPFRQRDGFRDWLRRVADSVPASELLHHASKIRNESVHPKLPDWPLRNRE